MAASDESAQKPTLQTKEQELQISTWVDKMPDAFAALLGSSDPELWYDSGVLGRAPSFQRRVIEALPPRHPRRTIWEAVQDADGQPQTEAASSHLSRAAPALGRLFLELERAVELEAVAASGAAPQSGKIRAEIAAYLIRMIAPAATPSGRPCPKLGLAAVIDGLKTPAVAAEAVRCLLLANAQNVAGRYLVAFTSGRPACAFFFRDFSDRLARAALDASLSGRLLGVLLNLRFQTAGHALFEVTLDVMVVRCPGRPHGDAELRRIFELLRRTYRHAQTHNWPLARRALLKILSDSSLLRRLNRASTDGAPWSEVYRAIEGSPAMARKVLENLMTLMETDPDAAWEFLLAISEARNDEIPGIRAAVDRVPGLLRAMGAVLHRRGEPVSYMTALLDEEEPRPQFLLGVLDALRRSGQDFRGTEMECRQLVDLACANGMCGAVYSAAESKRLPGVTTDQVLYAALRKSSDVNTRAKASHKVLSELRLLEVAPATVAAAIVAAPPGTNLELLTKYKYFWGRYDVAWYRNIMTELMQLGPQILCKWAVRWIDLGDWKAESGIIDALWTSIRGPTGRPRRGWQMQLLRQILPAASNVPSDLTALDCLYLSDWYPAADALILKALDERKLSVSNLVVETFAVGLSAKRRRLQRHLTKAVHASARVHLLVPFIRRGGMRFEAAESFDVEFWACSGWNDSDCGAGTVVAALVESGERGILGAMARRPELVDRLAYLMTGHDNRGPAHIAALTSMCESLDFARSISLLATRRSRGEGAIRAQVGLCHALLQAGPNARNALAERFWSLKSLQPEIRTLLETSLRADSLRADS